MKGNYLFESDADRKICLTGQGNEIFKIDKISVQMDQRPEIVFKEFQCTEQKFENCTDNVTVSVELYEESDIVAFVLAENILVRDDNRGYPFSLTMDNSMEIYLSMKEKAPFLANYQHKAWWVRPAFGKDFAEIPENTQLLIRRKGNIYEIFLAVCGEENRADLAGIADGIKISLSSNVTNRQRIQDIAVVYGFGENPYEVIEKCTKLVRKMKNNSFVLRKEKRYPQIFENMGWCTWDSLGQDVSEEAIFKKMDEFEEKNITMPWVLIDDGWSYVNKENLTLKSLDADPIKFPNGIAGTVKVLKEKYHVSYVGVWQAFKGYWNGLEENSEAYHIMAPYIMKYGDGEITVKPNEKDAFGFWNRWHGELKKKGIDFVKVDGQSSFSLMAKGVSSYGEAMNALYTGLEASAFLNFDGNLINCMGMAPENVWNRHYSAISRTSDDYMPTVKGSFTEHALQNCYNSVYHGELYFGDWDMFWSDHEETEQSAALRIISGGPVYISDAYGRTKKEELDKIMRLDGSLLKCSGIGRPTLDCLTEDIVKRGKILKIYNKCNHSIMVACFAGHCPGNRAEGIIYLKDIPDREHKSYRVFDWNTHKTGHCSEETDYLFSMGSEKVKILELVPEDMDILILGMVDKYIPYAGVAFVEWFEDRCLVKLNCSGVFSFITSKEIEKIYLNQKEASFEKEGDLYRMKTDHDNGEIVIMYKK